MVSDRVYEQCYLRWGIKCCTNHMPFCLSGKLLRRNQKSLRSNALQTSRTCSCTTSSHSMLLLGIGLMWVNGCSHTPRHNALPPAYHEASPRIQSFCTEILTWPYQLTNTNTWYQWCDEPELRSAAEDGPMWLCLTLGTTSRPQLCKRQRPAEALGGHRAAVCVSPNKHTPLAVKHLAVLPLHALGGTQTGN